MNRSTDRAAAGILTGALAWTLAFLAGCGGDSGSTLDESGGTGEQVRLLCSSACTPSPEVATENLKVYFYVNDEGQGAQAQGGFRDHDSAFYNVELSGDDKLYFVDGTAAPDRMLLRNAPPGELQFGGPYLADLANPLTPTREVSFVLQRGAATYTSTLTPPPAFAISTPSDGSTLPISSPSFPITLSAAEDSPALDLTQQDCVDANGNVSTGFEGDYDPSTAFVKVDDTHWMFDLATWLSKMTFTTDFPRGPVAHCAMKLWIQARTVGSPNSAFNANSFVTGLQTRTTAFTLQ